MDLETHCHVGSKRQCCTHVSNVEWQAMNKTLLLRAVESLYSGAASRITVRYALYC